MFTIKLFEGNDEILIYTDTFAGGDSSKLISPELDLKDNVAGTLTFTMPIGNPGYDIIKPITSTIEVYRDGEWLWTGRPLSISKDFWLNKQVTCEGALSFFNDTVQPVRSYKNVSFLSYITSLVNSHNNRSGLPVRRQIAVGAIDQTTISNRAITNVNVVTDNETTLSYLSSIVDEWGMHMYIKKIGGFLKLFIINGRNLNKATQDINFGKNLLDYSDNYDWSDIITVLHPIGKKLDTTNKTGDEDYPDYVTLNYNPPPESTTDEPGITEIGNGTSENSSITGTLGDEVVYLFDNESSTPAQGFTKEGEYLILNSAVNLYGRIERTVNWSEVDNSTVLLRLAEAYLSDYQYTEMELSVKVMDLHYISSAEDPYTAYNFLDRVDCKSKPHNLETTFIVTEMKIPFDNPENMTLSLSRNSTVGYGTGGSSSVKSGTISSSGSQVVPKNDLLKLAKENASSLMDMNTNGFVSFIPPANVTDNASLSPHRIPTTQANRTDRIAEIWIADDIDPNEATNRWRWNINGFCHQSRETISSNWDPPNVAITMDGAIIADFITAGVLLVPDSIVPDNTESGIIEPGYTGPNSDGILFKADMNTSTCQIADFTVTRDTLYSGNRYTIDPSLDSHNRTYWYGTYIGGFDNGLSDIGYSVESGSGYTIVEPGWIRGGYATDTGPHKYMTGYISFSTYVADMAIGAMRSLNFHVGDIFVGEYDHYDPNSPQRQNVITKACINGTRTVDLPNNKTLELEFTKGFCTAFNVETVQSQQTYKSGSVTANLPDSKKLHLTFSNGLCTQAYVEDPNEPTIEL